MNLTTDDADGKIRLDQYLAAHLPELSRSRIQSLIKSGDVLVNGTPAKPKNPVSRGDSITVRIPEPEPAEARPQDIPLDILYEDEDVVVINKESGMVVHPAARQPGRHHRERPAPPLRGPLRHRRRGTPRHRPPPGQGYVRLPGHCQERRSTPVPDGAVRGPQHGKTVPGRCPGHSLPKLRARFSPTLGAIP